MANPDKPNETGEGYETGQTEGQPAEIDPGKVGNNTEVDLDRTHIEKYPNPNNEPPRK